jgi:hypothetical protein
VKAPSQFCHIFRHFMAGAQQICIIIDHIWTADPKLA